MFIKHDVWEKNDASRLSQLYLSSYAKSTLRNPWNSVFLLTYKNNVKKRLCEENMHFTNIYRKSTCVPPKISIENYSLCPKKSHSKMKEQKHTNTRLTKTCQKPTNYQMLHPMGWTSGPPQTHPRGPTSPQGPTRHPQPLRENLFWFRSLLAPPRPRILWNLQRTPQGPPETKGTPTGPPRTPNYHQKDVQEPPGVTKDLPKAHEIRQGSSKEIDKSLKFIEANHMYKHILSFRKLPASWGPCSGRWRVGGGCEALTIPLHFQGE